MQVLEERDPNGPPTTVAAAMAKAAEEMPAEDKRNLNISETYIKGMVSSPSIFIAHSHPS